MICPYCKTKLPDGSQFCPKCGQAIAQKGKQSTASSSYWSAVATEAERDDKIRIDAENEIIRKQKKRNKATIASLIVIGIAGVIAFYAIFIYPNQRYKTAGELYNKGQYGEAISIYEKLGDFKDSSEQIIKCQEGITEQRYQEGIVELQNGNFKEALIIFEELGSYKESQSLKNDCNYQIAQSLVPIYHWDFSTSLSEQGGLTSNAHGDVRIKDVLNGGFGAAAYFDGDGDYIECGRGINLSDTFTFTALLCCQDVYKDYSAFFAKFEENGGPYAFSINQGRVNIWMTTEDGYHTEIESNTEIRNNEWYLISLTKDGESISLYINGQLDAEDTISSIHSGDDLVTIGRQALMFYPEEQLQFTGYISEISLYDQALSDNEILALYESKFRNQLYGTTSVHADIPEGALYWGTHHYAVFNNCKSWEEAAQYCESRGGYLATISSGDENTELFEFMKKNGYEGAYFGLSDSATEGDWIWANGENTVFLNWHQGEPNSESMEEDYAMFYYKFDDATWNDGKFGDGTTAFICEWDQ